MSVSPRRGFGEGQCYHPVRGPLHVHAVIRGVGSGFAALRTLAKSDLRHTGDGQVQVEDLLVLIGQYGNQASDADFDGDGVVGINDMLILLSNWSQ